MSMQLHIDDRDDEVVDYRKILTKYDIEPRGNYCGSDNWMVIFDLENNRYLTDGLHSKKYLRFKTSQAAIKYLIEIEYPGIKLEWRSTL